MKRKLTLHMLLSLLLLVALGAPLKSYGAETSVTCTTQKALENALAKASKDKGAPTVINISKSIDIDGQLVVEAGTYVILQSASSSDIKTLMADSEYENRDTSGMVLVKGNLTVKNLTLDADELGRVCLVNPGGSLTLGSKATIRNGQDMGASAAKGLGVYVRDGQKTNYGILKMKKGAKITGCTYTGHGYREEASGIGVYLGKYGSFTMTGGEISSNQDKGSGQINSSCAAGGGVYVQNYATMTMSGGKISKNSARVGGGGIYINGLNKSSQVILKGDALIAENKSVAQKQFSEYSRIFGGGICNIAGVIRMSENVVIRDNVAKSNIPLSYSGCGGGLYMADGEFYMDGGSFSGNVAEMDYQENKPADSDQLVPQGCGGAIFVKNGSCYISGGSITENQAKSDFDKNKYSGMGGGLCVSFDVEANNPSDAKAIVTGGQIKSNKAAKKGKDLYLFNMMYDINKDSLYGTVTSADPIGKTSHVILSGAPVIGDAYLPSDYKVSGKVESVSRFTLQGKLTKGASVGVRFASFKKGVVVADHTEDYTIRNSDISYFKLLNSGDTKLEAEVNNKGNLALAEVSSTSKKSLAKAEVTISSVTYNGKAQKPAPEVVLDGKTLKKDTDYSVSYEKNVQAGTGRCIINGKGKYSGTKEKTFKIKALSMTSSKLTYEALADKYAAGKELKPVPVIKLGDYKLNSTDVVDFTSTYTNNIEPGTATVTVTGKGNYTGSKELSFQILDGADGVISSEADLFEAMGKSQGSANAPVRLILDGDLALTSPCRIASGFYGILEGNGYEISMSTKQEADGTDPHKAMFMADASSSLDLEDLTISGRSNARLVYVGQSAQLIIGSHAILRQGKASGADQESLGGQCIYNEGSVSCQGVIEDSRAGYWGSIANYGDFTLEETGILRKLKTTSGGAVYNKGTFNLKGTISEAEGAESYGGAITNHGSFNMSSGSIENSSSSVPAIYNNGQATMSGGKICKNNNSQTSQVGVSGGTIFQNQGSFTMTGGSITDNTALEGGGVMIQGGSFHMKGASAQISNNTAHYKRTAGNFTASDFGNGGGIFLNNGEFILEAGSIKGNQASYELASDQEAKFNGYAGGIFLNGGKLTLKGGSVSGNKGQVKNMDGIYFGNQKVGSTGASKSEVILMGSPDIQDLIYMEKGKTFTIDGKLGDISCKVKQEGLKTGTVLAKYTNSADGQEADGGKFIAYGSDKTYSYDPEKGQIAVGKLALDQCSVKLDKEKYSYTGRAITPVVTVLDPKGKEVNNVVLKASNNVECGTATLVVSGDDYETTGEVTLTFKIVPRLLADKDVTIVEPRQIYTGKALTPEVTVKSNGRSLVQDQDYVLDYLDNVDGDNGDRMGLVEVTGMGNYTGLARAYFTIKSEASISLDKEASVACGESISLKPVIKAGDKKNASYRYKVADKDVLKVSAKGQVTGLKKGKTKVTVTLKESDTYYETSAVIQITTTQGKQSITGVKDSVTKVYTSDKWSLGAGTSGDGKLTYKSSDTSVASINKSGEVTCKGYGQTTITVTAAKTDSYKKAEKKITLYIKPKTLSVKSISNSAAGTVKVTWAKDSKADGYQLQYSTSSSMDKATVKTIGKNDTLSYQIKNLKKGKTCYVQIRAYKKVGDKALAGEWSKVKSVKVSK